MKTFDIKHFPDASGARMLIYPGGTEAKRAQGRYVDAPYIWVHFHTGGSDFIEVIRRGQVRERHTVYIRHPDDVDKTIQTILRLMREL